MTSYVYFLESWIRFGVVSPTRDPGKVAAANLPNPPYPNFLAALYTPFVAPVPAIKLKQKIKFYFDAYIN